MQYNKLVRDKIPEIITQKGEACRWHVADEDEYRNFLLHKLNEEVQEFLADESIEELADVLEVLDAMLAYREGVRDRVYAVQQKKRVARGGFFKRIVLEEA